MHYNHRYHHRRSIRLKGYDYAQTGLYFITICCNRQGNSRDNPVWLPFGNIENGVMHLNDPGRMIEKWFTNWKTNIPTNDATIWWLCPTISISLLKMWQWIKPNGTAMMGRGMMAPTGTPRHGRPYVGVPLPTSPTVGVPIPKPPITIIYPHTAPTIKNTVQPLAMQWIGLKP